MWGLDVRGTELGISDMGFEARTAGMKTLVKHSVARRTDQVVVADVLREERLAGAQLVDNGPDTPHVVGDLRIMTCAGEIMQECMDAQRDAPNLLTSFQHDNTAKVQ